MTLEQFGSLDQLEKEDIVWESGKFLVNLEKEREMCDVYQLSGFYVALCYVLKQNLKAHIFAAEGRNELLIKSGWVS